MKQSLVSVLGAAALVFLGSTAAWSQAVFLVADQSDAPDTNLADNICKTAGNTCTIRAAVQQANATPGVDTILIMPYTTGAYTLSITGTGEDAAATGDLDITEALTINAVAGSGSVIIDGGLIDRVFHVIGSAGQTGGVIMSNVTIRNGAVTGGNGGGILLDPTTEATLHTVVVTANATLGSSDLGGGIAVGTTSSGATLTIDAGSMVSVNSAGSSGGGIFAGYGSVLNATNVSIETNAAPDGGGLTTTVGASVSIRNSVVADNMATTTGGGGLHNGVCATLALTNTTVSGNKAKTFGGGVLNEFSYGCLTILRLANATIGFNRAGFGGTGDGGGLYNIDLGSGFWGIIQTKNSIISNNFDDTGGEAPDCGGRQLSGFGYNLIGDTTGCTIGGTLTGNQLNKNPNLLPLKNYGGLTKTHAITGSIATSFAYNKGTPGGCTDFSSVLLTTDQRGNARPFPADTLCDIGAYEAPKCGDSTITSPETCDDGNTIDGDTCDAACFIEGDDTDHNEPEAAAKTQGELVTAYNDCVTPDQSTVAPPTYVTFACEPSRSDSVCAFNDGTAGTIKGTYEVEPLVSGDVNVEIHLDGLQAACENHKLGVFVSFNETGHVCAIGEDPGEEDGYSACTRKLQQTSDIFVGSCTVVNASGNRKCDLNLNLNSSTGIQRYRKNRDTGLELRGFKVKRCPPGACSQASDFVTTTFVPGILIN
jgi:cysteine-rich repeat protein